MKRLWPKSLKGQMLLSLALALLLAQAISAALLYRAQHKGREAALVHTAAFRLIGASRREGPPPGPPLPSPPPPDGPDGRHRRGPPPELVGAPLSTRPEQTMRAPLRKDEHRFAQAESELRHILAEQDIDVTDLVVTYRAVNDDPVASRRLARGRAMLGEHASAILPQEAPGKVLVAAMRVRGNPAWSVVRVFLPGGERSLLLTLIGQTLLIYGILVGAVALIVRRITRPLAALTTRMERFADTRDVQGQLEPSGSDDIRRLFVAHNAMEGRIAALLDEKDVMLGAIGHDLKTPLSALRVRIESVEDDAERAKMARTIEDITRSLDDILSLARVGRPRDAKEATELSALVASVVEEYEDMGEPVTLTDSSRLVLPLRATWLRRALRNLVSNGLRYGHEARVELLRDGNWAVIRIDDDGPGIPESDIDRMLLPFTRGDPSRNSETGGAGLGLTLARAIAEQHGGMLTLANRRNAAGAVEGLTAELRLPIS